MTVLAPAGLDPCVHCGFCLQSCPTYLVTLDEADSPRGRIVLMRGLDAGTLSPGEPELQRHLDRCLGCRACEPVCPSGVEYGTALESARATLLSARPVSWIQRVVHAVMAEPSLRRPLLGLARLVRPVAGRFAGRSRVGFAMGMLGATRMGGSADRRFAGSTPRRTAEPTSRRAASFLGCIQADLFSHVHAATARVLAANGVVLLEVPHQGCCGALHAHAGQLDTARELARRNVLAFAALPPGVPIAVDAAGCGAMLREYGHLLADDPLAGPAKSLAARVRDVSELLAERGPRPGASLPLRVAYDAPCHLLHAQRVAEEPHAVLRAVPGLTVVPHEEAEVCCGSAGSYTLAQPSLSLEVLDRKLDALAAARPEVIATGNPGCIMQIGAGLLARGDPTPVVHPVELLDLSYARAGYYAD
ncbi:MAG: heterodisulfide reductase-related iron-sulfur binding cluster [Gemmatimonadales bacterium]